MLASLHAQNSLGARPPGGQCRPEMVSDVHLWQIGSNRMHSQQWLQPDPETSVFVKGFWTRDAVAPWRRS